MKFRKISKEPIPKARRGGSRDAIVDAAERLFLDRGFGAVSMDELAEAAGVARRTLYNQFSSKEEIFREMLLRVSRQLERPFRRHRNPRRCRGGTSSDRPDDSGAPQVPWISRLSAHGGGRAPPISLDRRGVRGRHGPSNRAAHPLPRPSDRDGHLGLPQSASSSSPVHGCPQRVLSLARDDGSRSVPIPADEVVEETIRMFLQRYKRA